MSLVLLTSGLALASRTIASDWVEDGVSEFRQSDEQRMRNLNRNSQNSVAAPSKQTNSNTNDPSKPLEATIRTFKKDYRRPSRYPGLDGYANNIMESAPVIPLPTTWH